MKKVKTLEEFAEYLQKGKHVFYFTADWCGDCRYLYPLMPAVDNQISEWQIVEVDRDQFIDVAKKWDIVGIPSFVAVNDGVEQGRLVNRKRKTPTEILSFIEGIE